MVSVEKLEELNLSHDEVMRFTEAMKKPEFKQLFFEYAQEISDPENRARYEREIRQMENERGMDVKFLKPEPGYVIKTSVNGDKKAFINVCKNENIGKPSSVKQVGADGRPGLNWSLPHSFTPPRDDLDKNGTKCVVYDFVVHPDTYRMTETNQRFKKMVNDTALDGIKKMFNVDVDRKNLKFPKLKYKGVPTASVIRTRLPENLDSETPELDEFSQKFPYPFDNKTSEEKAQELIDSNEKAQAGRAEQKNVKKKETLPENDFAIPKYTIKYQTDIDMQNFINTPIVGVQDSTRPKKLIVEVDLPLLQSANPISLDVFEKRILLVSQTPAKYRLDVNLAYPVDENEGSAKFDKNRKRLVITLPVLPAENIPLPFGGEMDSCKVESEDPEMHSDDRSDAINGLSENTKPLIEVISETESGDTENILDGKDKEKNECNNSHRIVDTGLDTLCVLPEFVAREDENSLYFIFGVKKVKKESLKSTVVSSDSVLVEMTSVGDGGFPVHYRCIFRFDDGCMVDADKCELSFTDEEDVRLLVTKDENSKRLWKSFAVATDLLSAFEQQQFEVETSCISPVPADPEIHDRKTSLCEDNEPFPIAEDKTTSEVGECEREPETSMIPTEKLDDDSMASGIVVVHTKETGDLHGILKHPATVTESGDFSHVTSVSRQSSVVTSGSDEDSRESSDDVLSGSQSEFKKSVSFSEHVDQAVFSSSQSISQMHSTLKKKQRNAKRRELRKHLKQERKLCRNDCHEDQAENQCCDDSEDGAVALAGDVSQSIESQELESKLGVEKQDIENDCKNTVFESYESNAYSCKNTVADEIALPTENGVEKDVSDKNSRQTFKPTSIPLISDQRCSTSECVSAEKRMNLTVELKNKFVFDLDVD